MRDKNFRDGRKTRKVTKTHDQESRGSNNKPGWVKATRCHLQTDCDSPACRRKKKSERHSEAIQNHQFDFVISCRVLQFDLRVNIDMDSWFSFYLYLQRCDVTRYIRTIIYPYTHNCQKRMPVGAWLFLDVPFRRPPVFLFPYPFRVCLLRARCVGVGVCSFPLLLRSPPRVLVKSLSSHPHIHLISNSLSSSPSSHLSGRQRGVCVNHLKRSKTSNLLHFSFAGGCRECHSSAANEDGYDIL